jgi:hypothetical protein
MVCCRKSATIFQHNRKIANCNESRHIASEIENRWDSLTNQFQEDQTQ